MLAGELVDAVDAAVAGIAEGGLISAAEDRGLIPVANITPYLHCLRNENQLERTRKRSGSSMEEI